MPGQDTLDRAFNVTPKERELLRNGKIPMSIHDRLQALSRSSLAQAWPSLIWLLILVGLALGLLFFVTRDERQLSVLLLLVLPLISTIPIFVVRTLDWRHERKVFAERQPLRTIEGTVETIQTWQCGHGIVFLSTSLKFVEQSENPVYLCDTLEKLTISGWARVFLVKVPTRKGILAPYYETPVAIEVADDTVLVERDPGMPPPEEALRVNVPAD